ncbi:MAG TPA: DUF1850 domain-containing protein [Marinobacter sp.]|nr:DUF1850 domain-containing protein [Marinobacter sp.]
MPEPMLRWIGWFWLLWVCLPSAASAADGQGPQQWLLEVVNHQGVIIAKAPVPESGEWCLLWNHSVEGFPVADCFRISGNQLLLDSSHTPDFAAGLGYIDGRGRLESDQNHGYRIEDMNVPIKGNVLPLRVGSTEVRHRIQIGKRLLELSQIASGQRVNIRIIPYRF